MLEKDKIALRDASPYNAAITREQWNIQTGDVQEG